MDWENVRRVRQPVAWILLIISAVGVVIGVWTLFGLPGGPLAPPNFLGGGVPFHLRAESALTDFGDTGLIVSPVFAVLLVTFVGGVAKQAHLVVQIAVALQILVLGLSLESLLGTLSSGNSAWFYISEAKPVGLAVAGLTLTVAILRSRVVRDAG